MSPDEPDGLDAPFCVDAWFVGQVKENLIDWFERPRFTYRSHLSEWIVDSPPVEAAE